MNGGEAGGKHEYISLKEKTSDMEGLDYNIRFYPRLSLHQVHKEHTYGLQNFVTGAVIFREIFHL